MLVVVLHFIVVFVMLVVVVFTFLGHLSMPAACHPGFSGL